MNDEIRAYLQQLSEAEKRQILSELLRSHSLRDAGKRQGGTVRSKLVSTSRLTTRVLTSEHSHGRPILFLHGNAAMASFWESALAALPLSYYGIAPDLRGCGVARIARPINARLGVTDLVDDAIALLNTLGIERAFLVGHSLGGMVIWNMLIDHPERIAGAVLVAPCSPYGFGGSYGLDGKLCWPDAAGSGSGAMRLVEQAWTRMLGRASTAPRIKARLLQALGHHTIAGALHSSGFSTLMNSKSPEQVDFVDTTPSAHWPYVAPGSTGSLNAIAPGYPLSVERLGTATVRPPVLWLRGADDLIVADKSIFDLGFLGSEGFFEDWPGADVFPAQPMIAQTRSVLDRYRRAGGSVYEVVLERCGHAPHLQQPERFSQELYAYLATCA